MLWKIAHHQLVSCLRELCAIIPYLSDFTRSLILLYSHMFTLQFWVWTLVWWWLEGHICISTRFCRQSLHNLCVGIQSDSGDTHREPCNTGKSNFHASYSCGETAHLVLTPNSVFSEVMVEKKSLDSANERGGSILESPRTRWGTPGVGAGRQPLPLETLENIFSPLGRQWCSMNCLKPQYELVAGWLDLSW